MLKLLTPMCLFHRSPGGQWVAGEVRVLYHLACALVGEASSLFAFWVAECHWPVVDVVRAEVLE